MVKSRRRASSSGPVNSTRSGCRPSAYGPLAPEAGHVVLALLQAHEDDAELRPHGDGALEELQHPSGVGVGGHVPVLRPAAQQQVADAAAGEVGPVAGAAETLDHRRRAGIDLPGIDGTYLPHSGTPARLSGRPAARARSREER